MFSSSGASRSTGSRRGSPGCGTGPVPWPSPSAPRVRAAGNDGGALDQRRGVAGGRGQGGQDGRRRPAVARLRPRRQYGRGPAPAPGGGRPGGRGGHLPVHRTGPVRRFRCGHHVACRLYDEVADALWRYRQLGVTHFVLSDTPYREQTVEVGDNLLPRLRSQESSPSDQAAASTAAGSATRP